METVKTMTATEYFNHIKEKKETVNDESLTNLYENCLKLIRKYKITGQKKALKKLIFQVDVIEKERELVKAGIDTFVYRDDIMDFIETVQNKVVKIIEIENYERDIPDDIVDRLEKVQHLFDEFLIVFTDYTKKEEKKIAKIRKEKDPILFGVFRDKSNNILVDRFYFIGDWEDEFCDLTLDKMVKTMKKEKKKNIEHEVITPEEMTELKKELKMLKEDKGGNFTTWNDSSTSMRTYRF